MTNELHVCPVCIEVRVAATNFFLVLLALSMAGDFLFIWRIAHDPSVSGAIFVVTVLFRGIVALGIVGIGLGLWADRRNLLEQIGELASKAG